MNIHHFVAAISPRATPSRRTYLLVSAALLAAPSVAHAAPELFVGGGGGAANASITFAPPPTTGSLNQAVVAISTGSAVNITVTGTGALDATQSTGMLLSAPAPSTLTTDAGGNITGLIGVDASAHSDLETTPENVNGPGVTGGLALTNAGTIIGTGGTAVQFGSGPNTLTLETGSSITGAVDGGASGDNAVVLNGTITTQTATQTAGAYTNFQTLSVDAGYWTLSGAASYPTTAIASGATLQVTNSLTSAVTVQPSGALILGDGTNQGQLIGALVDNGSVTFDEPSDYQFNGAFSGSGSLVKDGAGVLTFDGLYSFTGVTTINGGSIDIAQLAAGTNLVVNSGAVNLIGTSSSIGNLSGTGGVVNVGAGDTLTVLEGDFGGNISGAGGLTKSGSGTLVLSGTDSLSGPTSVAGGVLQIEGSLSSDVTVDDGATLGGAGLITGSVTVASGGVFSPGDPVTTHVIGPLSFLTGSSYFAQVTPTGGHDLIAVTGPVMIQHGASVEVDPLGLATAYGRYSTYAIITATDGVTGTFSNVTSDAPLLTPHLTYPGDTVQLTLTRSDISFASLGTTANQRATAAAAEAGGFGTPLYMALAVQNTAGAQAGYDALSGELFASLPTVLLLQADQTRRTLTGRMQQTSDIRGLWGQAIGSWASFDGGGGVAGAQSNVGGGTIGLDDTFHGWRLGVAGSYDQDNIDIAQRTSSAVDQAEEISVYAAGAAGPLAVDLGASYAWHRIATSRDEVFPGFRDHSTARFGAGTTQAFGDVGYNFTAQGDVVEPFAGVSYDEVSTQAAAEHGGPSALAVAGQTRQVISTHVGLRASADLGTTLNPALTLHGSLDWRHASDDLAGAAQAAFEGTHQGFAVDGLPIARDAAEITAGISARVSARGSIDLAYSGEVSSHVQDNGVKLLASWAF